MASRLLATNSILLAPTLALFLAGYSFALSYTSIPALYTERPHRSTSIFKRMFHGSGTIAVSLSFLSTAMSGYLAFWSSAPRIRQLYSWAAVATMLPVGFTRVFMDGEMRRAIEISESEELQKRSEDTRLHGLVMRKCVRQNYLRSVLYAVVGYLGLQAAIFG